MVTSEWGRPPQFENGLVPEDLLSNKYGHRLHFWDLRARRNVQTIDLGANHQMPLEVRPAHDPVREYGFVGVVVDTTNLEGSIWTWWREGGKFHIEKTATIPPEPAAAENLPPLLQGFGAVPPLVSDIDLSLDDRFLYVACWGTGEMRQYDVTDPRQAGTGGLGPRRRHRATHAASQWQSFCGRPADGGDQPRRQTRLLDQFALLDLGRPVLSRRCSWRRSHGQREPGWWPQTRSGLLGAIPGRISRAPDQARGRRLLDGLVLLSRRPERGRMGWHNGGTLAGPDRASGLYHGFNPAMGWPLAVSAGLMERSSRAVVAALGPLTVGHLLAMLAVLLPFALLVVLVQWQRQIRNRGQLLVIAFGRPAARRAAPSARARAHTAHATGLWSFAVAIAHGAGLMLVPIYLGMCRAAETDRGHVAANELMQSNVVMALAVAVVHSLAMMAAGGGTAWLVYRYLGLGFISRGWLDTRFIWAASLILVGAVSLHSSL